MINRILLISLFLVSLETYGQNPKELLKECYSKCLTIKNGHYEMGLKIKFMDSKDTSWNCHYNFYFNKLKNDPLYSIAFNCELFSHGRYISNYLYTGVDFVTFCKLDSTAKVMSKAKWINTLINLRHNYTISFYSPFTDSLCYPLPKSSDYTDNRHFFNYIGKQSENNIKCLHVRMVEYPTYDSVDVLHSMEVKYDYWINSENMVPVKYSITTKYLRFNDTLTEFMCYTLKKYDLNNSKNLLPLQLSAIPSYCNVQDYVEPIKIHRLRNDTIAPGFTLTSLQLKKVSLSDFKGQLILLDFFYKECYPCIKALPVLQSLHQKYHSKGLEVVGIDPVDKEMDEIKHFISQAGITYSILFDEKDVNKDYHITGYPTVYLIDKKGRIIYTYSGFSEALEGQLEEIIKRNL